jgi:hypothetical protein
MAANKKDSIPEVTLQFHKTNVYGKISSSEDVATFIRSLFPEGSVELQEQVIVLYLNRANDIIGFYRHSKGGIAGTVMDVRLILSAAIKSLSSAMIIAHNHPSGQTKPSTTDIHMAEQIKKSAQLFDIKLFDNLIITKESYYSFADEGLVGLSTYKNEGMMRIVEDKKTSGVTEVERIDDEVRFIKGYAAMQGKVKTAIQILSFLNAVQKAILEKRIRKTSPYAKEIQYIQTNLAKLYNVMKDKTEISIHKDVLNRFMKIAFSKKQRLSVSYLKRYIGIQGKHITKEKAERLIVAMKNAVKLRKLTKDDPYVSRLEEAYGSLEQFVKNAKKNDTLEIHPSILNGIDEAFEGLGCNCGVKEDELHGIEESLNSNTETASQPSIMNSMDFAKLKFETLGFTGKWKELIGDPSKGFTAMVYGKPKMGKSYLCVDFAGYLARNHGNVLYVANEEKLDKTLQDKLNGKDVKHVNLFVSDHLPEDLSSYQFIFLDSVNKLGLKPEDLEQLKNDNPGKSFIYIFQTTKEGNFRGANQFQHDVDVVIEIPERGKAVQFGRFNQGSEMVIFEKIDEPS